MSLQNRMLNGFSVLAGLDQHELPIKNEQRIAFQLESAASPLLEMMQRRIASKKQILGRDK